MFDASRGGGVGKTGKNAPPKAEDFFTVNSQGRSCCRPGHLWLKIPEYEKADNLNLYAFFERSESYPILSCQHGMGRPCIAAPMALIW
jgi:hypothetical protein